VLLFVAHDCPISNSYAPEINRLQSQFGKQNIGFYIVYVDSNMSATAARKHAHDYAFKSTLLLDTKHVLAKQRERRSRPKRCNPAGRQADLPRTYRQQARSIWKNAPRSNTARLARCASTRA
jgi:hypothetical protein